VEADFLADGERAGPGRFDEMQAQGIARRVEKHEDQGIERRYGAEAPGKVVKERSQFTLLGNGFPNSEESLDLPPGLFPALPACWGGIARLGRIR
jgi:hypothetical protein